MEELKKALLTDKDMKRILQIIKDLQLKDSWLCAGSLRNFIWNMESGQSAFDATTDVDVIFYDETISYEETCALEEKLRADYSDYKWELKNQVYMHIHSPHTEPYKNSQDAMSKYPETCTAIGARLDEEGQLEIFCPYGLDLIRNFKVKPTPHFLADQERKALYNQRLSKKNWIEKWPQLKLEWAN